MRHIDIPYFGIIDPFSVEEEYSGGLELRNVEVMLDLNFETQWISPDRLQAVKDVLDKITVIDDKNRQLLREQYMDPALHKVRYYLEFLQEKIWRSALEVLVDFSNQSTPPREQMLNSMHLVRAGFYPDLENGFAVFDYSIGYDYTEYVLTLSLNANGELQEITTEM
jgi:hypothetical protein